MKATRTLDAWAVQEGRDLDPLPAAPGNWNRIVACLNIWNDLAELRANYESWYPFVDRVIAVDGAYEGMGGNAGLSTDGTREFLQSLDKVTLVDAPGLVQHDKRSLYFREAKPGDLLWRIDADERFENAAAIRSTPHLDVGWIRYTAPIYKREQGIPAVFAYREGLHYRDRHHWVYDAEGELVSTQQRGGAGLIHRLLPITMHNSRGEKRDHIRVQLAKEQRRGQVAAEQQASTLRTQGHEPLRVLQLGVIDPGITIARLHSAINTTSPHSSIMATVANEWTKPPRQYSLRTDRRIVAAALMASDIVHCHINYEGLKFLGVEKRKIKSKLVIHHHGTNLRRFPDRHNRDDAALGAVRLVSNYELMQYGEDLRYLPNPVPFANYQALGELHRPAWKRGTLRIAHSPTKRENKATDIFLKVCERLNAKNLNIEPVLIERTPWADALVAKAGCHATFDSMWLGMQNSGLEGAAMGQPVIAGDVNCRHEYEARHGHVPYTYANDETELEDTIEALATDHDYYQLEQRSVGHFVLEHHDYANVVARYLDLLDEAKGWRNQLTLGRTKVSA